MIDNVIREKISSFVSSSSSSNKSLEEADYIALFDTVLSSSSRKEFKNSQEKFEHLSLKLAERVLTSIAAVSSQSPSIPKAKNEKTGIAKQVKANDALKDTPNENKAFFVSIKEGKQEKRTANGSGLSPNSNNNGQGLNTTPQQPVISTKQRVAQYKNDLLVVQFYQKKTKVSGTGELVTKTLNESSLIVMNQIINNIPYYSLYWKEKKNREFLHWSIFWLSDNLLLFSGDGCQVSWNNELADLTQAIMRPANKPFYDLFKPVHKTWKKINEVVKKGSIANLTQYKPKLNLGCLMFQERLSKFLEEHLEEVVKDFPISPPKAFEKYSKDTMTSMFRFIEKQKDYAYGLARIIKVLREMSINESSLKFLSLREQSLCEALKNDTGNGDLVEFILRNSN